MQGSIARHPFPGYFGNSAGTTAYFLAYGSGAPGVLPSCLFRASPALLKLQQQRWLPDPSCGFPLSALPWTQQIHLVANTDCSTALLPADDSLCLHLAWR